MSKYRVVITPSRLKVLLLALMWGLLVVSLFQWQRDILANQIVWQLLAAAGLVVLAYKSLRKTASLLPFTVAFDQQGEWIYLEQAAQQTAQQQWQMTQKSRLSHWLLWIELASIADPAQRHWLVIFRDQLDEQHFRRLCRAILCQQHMSKR